MPQTHRFKNMRCRTSLYGYKPPEQDGTLELTIDWGRLAQMIGNRAASNLRKRSTALNGIIKAKWIPL